MPQQATKPDQQQTIRNNEQTIRNNEQNQINDRHTATTHRIGSATDMRQQPIEHDQQADIPQIFVQLIMDGSAMTFYSGDLLNVHYQL
jgi:hypothetical protein